LAGARATDWHGDSAEVPHLRAALPRDSIRHILVIDLENESFDSTFGASSPAVYLNQTLRPRGELIEGYYATSHASLGNYISLISGQSATNTTKADCSNFPSLSPPFTGIQFFFTDVKPGVDDPFPATNPGQMDGQGCIYPAPKAGSHGAPTITDQLDARFPPDPATHRAAWPQLRRRHGQRSRARQRRSGPTGRHGLRAPANWRGRQCRNRHAD
jgi:hypothetical protein